MAGRVNRKTKDKVQIDADWLLGESTDKASGQHTWFLRCVSLLLCVVAAVWGWPYASKQWLQWEWHKQLSLVTNGPTEDVLPILLALHEINPNNSESAVEQLASQDSEKRLIAFHLLQKRIEHWSPSNLPPNSELVAMTEALKKMPGQLPESHLLRGKLAARLLRLVGPELPNASILKSSLDGMVAYAAPPSSPASSPATYTAKNVSAQLASNTKLSEVSPQEKIADTAPSTATSASPSNSQPDPPTIARLHDSTLDPLPSSMSPSTPVANRNPKKPAPVVVSVTPEITENSKSAKAILSPPNPMRTTDFVASKMAPTEEPIASPPAVEQVPIRGLDRLPLESIFLHLSSTQSRLVEQASNELLRRGFKQSQLEMALRLAQGDVEERLAEMENLVRDASIADKIPWLFPLAENADRRVRQRAIVMLGSISGDEARRRIRMLGQRESDPAIAEQINQVLLASGSGANSRR